MKSSTIPAFVRYRKTSPRSKRQGFQLLTSFPLPPEDFYNGYYELLEQRGQKMKSARPTDEAAQNAANAILKEIEVWNDCKGDFSYVFYVAQPR